jgi:hypothetical protein
MTISPENFVDRLGAISERDGIPFARVHLLFDEEEKHSQETLKYNGYLALSDAFKCFFIDTVVLFNAECYPKMHSPISEFYAVFIPRLTHSFRSLCAAERIAIRGYPYQGYTLLRNVFDDTVLTSAALQKFTDFYSIEGIKPDKQLDAGAIKKFRKLTESAVRKKMTGSLSGLSQETLVELAMLDALFDYETHGARLSLTQAMAWMRGTTPLAVLPRFDESAFAMFINRFCEVGWMTHRLIPAIQPPGVLLSEGWGTKWRLIDESFRILVESLTREFGKKVGAALVEFVNAKFPFDERSTFPL